MNSPVKRAPIPFGKYLLLDRINIGGMAEVWRGKTFGAGGFERLVAIKRILPNIAEDEEFITMFIDEAKITVQLNHANIAQIYELSHIASSYFIAMEYIPGKDMRAIFDRCRKKGEPAPIPLTCYVIGKCCEGLDYAHRKNVNGKDLNIVHRDVSPQNVLISYEGEVKVIDFGIAKAAGKATKTQAGILKGKFGYMSPEQIRGLPLDRRSDVFAIGVCLYEMLTGERLFVGDSDFSVLEKVRKVEVLPPSTYNRKIPEGLEKIVMKALAKDVDDRYQYASEVADDLQRFLITSESIFSRKDLAQYMKSTFAEEVEREKQRLIEYADIKADTLPPPAPVVANVGLSEQLPPTVASPIGAPLPGSARSSHPSLPQVGASHAQIISPQPSSPRVSPPMLTPSPVPQAPAPAPQDALPALSGRPSGSNLPRLTAAAPILTNGKEDPSTHLVDQETLFNPGAPGEPDNPELATVSMDSPFAQGLTVTGEVGSSMPATDPARPAVQRSGASVISTSEHTPATPIAPISPVPDTTLPPSGPPQSLAALAKATVVESPRANPAMRGRAGGGRSNPTMQPVGNDAVEEAQGAPAAVSARGPVKTEAKPLTEPKSAGGGLQQRRRRPSTALPAGGPGASAAGEQRFIEPVTVPVPTKEKEQPAPVETRSGGGTGKILAVLMVAVVLVLGAAVAALFLLKPEAKGLIVIEVPDAVEVTDLNINGDAVPQPNFPLLQKVPVGNVTVMIKAKGYKPFMETVSVKADGVPAHLTQTFEKVEK